MKEEKMASIAGLAEELCTGCGLCANVCPVDAICIEENKEGFYMPVVDEKTCIQCGKCKKTCPSIGNVNANLASPEIYMAAASWEDRKGSSSGGVFPVLARYILGQGGAVAGVGYDENHEAVYMLIDTEEELEKLKGSKYVQAATKDIYKKVLERLDRQKILFSGCPCQVAAIKKFVEGKSGKEENLYTTDVICHGVPSPKVFRKYFAELADGEPITEINFRDKSLGWTCSNLHFATGRREVDFYDKEDWYVKGFLAALNRRKSCAICPYSQLPRIGDITLGDCWGIEKHANYLNDTGGLSFVSLNNDKGKELFFMTKADYEILEKTDLELIKKYNGNFWKNKKSHKQRDRFYELTESSYSVKHALELALNNRWDVGVVGVWCGPNYGNLVSHYSLYTILKEMNYSLQMIAGVGVDWKKRSPLVTSFIEKYYDKKDLAPFVNKTPDLWDYNDKCESFLVASDQIWKPELYKDQKELYSLSFVKDCRRKITYAVSFGHDYYHGDPETKDFLHHNIGRINSLAVREDSAVDICRDVFDVSAVQVLDPVFLPGAELFEKMALSSDRNARGKVASYVLEPNLNKENVVNTVCRMLGKESINATSLRREKARISGWRLETEDNLHVEDWLSMIMGADFVVTDSYHGLCMSIVFHRPFIVIEHENRGNGRFYSLLKLLNLENRMVTSPSETDAIKACLEHQIDWEQVESILNKEREKSIQWLKNALETKHDFRPTDRDMIHAELNKLQKTRLYQLHASYGKFKKSLSQRGKKETLKRILKKIF